MGKNRGVTVWLPFSQAFALVAELEGRPLTEKARKAVEKLREATVAHRLGHTRRPKTPNGDY